MLVSYFAYSWKAPTDDADACAGSYDDDDDSTTFVVSLDAPWSRNSEAIACESIASIIKWSINFLNLIWEGVIVVSLGNI